MNEPQQEPALFKPGEMPPEVRLPDQIRRQVADGVGAFTSQDERRKERARQVAQIATPLDPQREPAPLPAPVEEQPPAQAVQDKPAPQPKPEPEPEPEPGRVSQAEYDRLQAAHTALQGKYNAEVPRFAAELADMREQLKSISAKPATPLTEVPVERRVTAEEIAAYGPDLIDVIGRRAEEIARQIVGPQIAALEAKLGATETTLKAVNRDTEAAVAGTMEAYLSQHLPNWREVNADPAFLAWLNEADVMSGIQRIYYLKDAKDRRQFDRVVTIFKGYLSATGNNAQHEPNAAPVPDTRQALQLDTLAAPNPRRRATPAPQPSSQAQEVISPVAISRFYRDKAAGVYHGRDAEVAAIEARIFAAARDNRVVR